MTDLEGMEIEIRSLAEATHKIAQHLYSPNVADSNLEAANLVDTTDKIARGLFAIAEAIDRYTKSNQEPF